ncbi:MAG TPA: DUF1080 domain-containing protein [Pirellulaceae bacterium]|nr:DUF1080 domain-containing protein [Pirellulaceae bacterium]
MTRTTRYIVALLLGVSLNPAALAAGELSEEEKAAGFVPLFNGTDLTGWRFTGSDESPPKVLPENWKVEEGVIKVTGGGKPHLATAEKFADFELRLEWRGMRDKYNSGLFIRSKPDLGANQLNLARGSEGAFINGKVEGARPAGDLQKAPGEWNEWRIVAVGEKLTFYCNGQLAWEATGFKPAEGHIGLQAEGAPLEFRNIRLRKIE